MAINLLPDSLGKAEARRKAARAIEALTDLEIRRLNGFARSICRARRRVISEEGEDLSQEAFLRTLDGRRAINANVALTAHLKGVVRSVAHDRLCEGTEALEATKSLRRETMSIGVPDPGKERAQEIVRRATALLTRDAAALQVLDSMLSGQRPEEARRILGMDSRSYNAARQRIRRRVVSAADTVRPKCRHRSFSAGQAS